MRIRDRQPSTSPLFTLAMILLMAALWGSSYSFIKIALGSVTPFTLTAARMVIAATMLWAIVALRRRPVPREGWYWRRLLIQSFVNVMLPFSAFAWGQQYVSAGLAGIINSCSPIFVFLMTALWTRHEKAGTERLFGTVVGLGGVTTIIGLDALGGIGDHVIAEGVLLVGTLGYAAAAVHGRHFDGIPPEVTAAGTLAIGALVLTPIAFLVEQPLTLQPSTEAVLAVFYTGIFSTGVTFLIYFLLVQRVGSMNTVTASYLRAGFAVAFGMVLLLEPFTWRIAVGLAGVIVGVAAISGQFSRVWRALTGTSGDGEDGDRPAPLIR